MKINYDCVDLGGGKRMIRRIHLENYRCYENNSIYFKDLSIVVGKNNE